MVNIFLNGCCGRMGKAIAALCENNPDYKIVAGGDIIENTSYGFPVYDPARSEMHMHPKPVPQQFPQDLHLYLSHDLGRDLPAIPVIADMQHRFFRVKDTQIFQCLCEICFIVEKDPARAERLKH